MTTNIDVGAVLRAIAADPALAEAFRAALGVQTPQPTRATAKPMGEPFPALSEISLMIATCWDNGEDIPGRFKLTFEVWMDDPSTVRLSQPDWKKSVTLRNRKETRKQLIRLRKRRSISDSYAEILASYLDNSGEEFSYGLFCDKSSGTIYFEDQFVMVRMIESQPVEMILVNGDEHWGLAGFVDRHEKGAPLTGKAKAQMRHEVEPYRQGWGTSSPLGGAS